MHTRRSARRAQVLGLAAMSGLGIHHAKEGEGGGGTGGGQGEGEKPAKMELTEEEFNRRAGEIAANAVKDALKKRDDEEASARRKRAKGDDGNEEEEEEDTEEVIAKAERRAAEAEQRAAEAERKALMGEVNNKLRDYLVANYKEFLGNAPDIILHIERSLPKDKAPTEQEIQRQIESHTKAFVDRSGKRGGAGAPGGGTRGRMNGGQNQGGGGAAPETKREQPPVQQRFRTITYHG